MVISADSQRNIEELSNSAFMTLFKQQWQQGEHVLLCGPTGTGKTTVAHNLLDFRDFVAVFAVKRRDDTLDKFKAKHYKIIKKWPPDYSVKKVIFWQKPESLEAAALDAQATAFHRAFSQIYVSGGWCVYLDEAGYIAGVLRLGSDIGILLNQGRSSHISVVATMTRPTSTVARVPKEAVNQVRHSLIFKFGNRDESDTCAQIASVSKNEMWSIMQLLQFHRDPSNGSRFSDFAYFHEGRAIIVRAGKEG